MPVHFKGTLWPLHMKRSRLLIATGYGLALLLLVLPLLEPVVALLPPRPDQIRWRLEAFGAFSQVLVLPLVGGVVALGTAVLLGQRTVVRVLSVVAFLSGLVLAAAAMLFTLDLLQYRGEVGPELREFYEVAGAIYLVAIILGSLFLLWIGPVAWRAATQTRRKFRRIRVRLKSAPQPGTWHPGS